MKNTHKMKYIAAFFSILMIIVGFSVPTISEENDTKDTHTVLIEQCTASNCYYCQFVDNELPYVSGDWERVSLGHSTYSVGAGYNGDINQRVNELGMSGGFPNTYFDGGYQEVGGGWTGMLTDLQAAYDACAARDVPDLDIELAVAWLGDAEMEVSIDIVNNEGSTYDGNIKVYILEIESRWNAYTGEPMVNGLLGFSLDEDISISASGSYHDVHTWDGDNHGYGDITSDNIRCLAVLSDGSMIVDQVVGVFPTTNFAPTAGFTYTPEFPAPLDTITFTDTSSDSDGTIVSWDWDFGDGNTATIQNPTHSYDEEGYYTVSLTVEDDDGATTEYTEVIIVKNDDILAVQTHSDRGFPVRHALDGDWGGAQSFAIPGGATITSVDIKLRKFGTPEFDLIVELREDSPEGTLIDTKTFTPAEAPSNWEFFTIDFADHYLADGVIGFIVLPPAPSGVTTSFGYEFAYAFGNQYDDGAFWFTRDGGGLWRDLPTMYEYAFGVFGILP